MAKEVFRSGSESYQVNNIASGSEAGTNVQVLKGIYKLNSEWRTELVLECHPVRHHFQ